MLRANDEQIEDSSTVNIIPASPIKTMMEFKREVVESDSSSQKVSGRYRIIKPDEKCKKSGIADHSNKIINKHYTRLQKYGVSVDSDQVYPYSK